MAKKTPDEISPVYLFRGKDDYSKQKEMDAFIAGLTDDNFRDFDFEELSGETATSHKVLTGVSIHPWGSKKKIVLIKYAHKMSREEQRLLGNNLSQIPNSGCLILYTPAPELKDGKPMASYEIAPDLLSAIKKIGTVKSFEPFTKKRDIADKVIPFAQTLFKDAGKSIDYNAISLFVSRVGTDFTLLATEACKVINYAGSETKITSAMINNVTSLTPDEKVFEFLENVCNRQASKAVSMVEDLFTDGNDPSVTTMKLIALLSGQIRQIWQARILIEKFPDLTLPLINGSRQSVKREDIDEETASCFPKNSILSKEAWMQTKFLKMAQSNSYTALSKWIIHLEYADASIKGYNYLNEEPVDIVKLLVYNMVRSNKAEERR